MRRIDIPGELGRDLRHAAFVAREDGVWRIAAVRDGEVIQPDGPVDARRLRRAPKPTASAREDTTPWARPS